jgi:hypothetical protein
VVVACSWLQGNEVRTLLVPEGVLWIERFGPDGEPAELRSVMATAGRTARVELGR